jgi:hypothetical protein
VEVVSGDYSGDIVIPEVVTYNDTEYSVIAIGNSAFRDCANLHSIVIPEGVTTIGNYAFGWCDNLQSVTLPESLTTIGISAFDACGDLQSIILPGSVITIGNYAFVNCQNLQSVTLQEGLITIGNSAFRYCSNLQSITIPGSVTTIGDDVFDGCRALSTLVCLNPEPPTVSENTFNECPIVAVYVPSEAIADYQSAEGWSNFYIVDVANKPDELVLNFTVDGLNYRVTSLQDSQVEVVSGDYSGDIVIPEAVTYADTEYTVTGIANRAFQWSGITSVEIPASVTTIGDDAFQGTQISAIEIPTSVTSIGSWAFEYCGSLTIVTSMNPVPPTTGENTFNECPIVAVYVPAEAIEAYQSAEGWSNFYIVDVANKPAELVTNFTVDGINYRVTSLQENLVEVVSGDYSVIPEIVTYADTEYTVTGIANRAFQWSGITSVEIPVSVTTIGSWAFEYCRSLTIVTSMNPVPPTTGENTFNECPIVAVRVPAEAIEAYQSAEGWKDFYICDVANEVVANFTVDGINYRVTSLQDNLVEVVSGDYSGDIVIPEAVTYADSEYTVTGIANRAFRWSGITSVEIPTSVTTIGSWAFEYCGSLTIVTSMNPVPPTTGENTFNECPIVAVRVPAEAIEAYQSVEGWKDFYICDVANEVVANFTVDGINYRVTSLQDSHVEVVSGDYSGDIVIPEVVTYNDTEYSVIAIGESAFENCNELQSVTLPESVTTIGTYAFRNCTSLQSVTLPESVTTIEDYAFYRCTSLQSVTLPESVTTIGRYVFYGCTSLQSVILPESVTTIERYTFRRCTSLQSITIPRNVTKIDRYAFGDCTSLSTLVCLNPAPPTVGENTFNECPIVAVYVPAEAIEDYQSAEGWRDFYICDVANKPDELVTNFTVDGINYRVTSLQENLVEVVSGDYSGGIVIPEIVTYADTEYTVTGIANRAFQWKGITSVEIPASVTSIGSWAFEYCSSLASITSLNPVPPTTGENTFNECSIAAVYVPSEAIEDYQSAEGWSNFYIVDVANKPDELVTNFTVNGINYQITSFTDQTVEVTSGDYSGDIVIPEVVTYDDNEYAVTKIGDNAFEGSSIENVTIPGSVTTIGDEAFYGCESLTSLMLEDGVKTIGWGAFTGCCLESVTIPGSVMTIGEYAFAGCERLTSLILEEGVKKICWYAFAWCPSLESVTIPESVTWIGNGTFQDCENLSSITCTSEVLSLGWDVFSGVTATAYVPIASADLYEGFDWGGDITIEYLNDYKRSTRAGAFGTICLPYDYTPEGATLYGIESIEDDEVILTAVEGNHGLANTVYIYRATEAEQNFPYVPGEDLNFGDDVTTGALTSPAEYCSVPEGSYVLQTQNGVQAFYLVDSEIYIKPHRAYLTLDGNWAAPRLHFTIQEGNLTGLDAIRALTQGTPVIHDLNGRQLNTLQKGLNIVNGVKVIVK